MNTVLIAYVLVLSTPLVHCVAWNAGLSSCEDSRNNFAGTVYATASHFWPLKSFSSLIDIIQCKAALEVYGTIRTMTSTDGLYGISTDGRNGVKLATLNEGCLKNLAHCEDGFSVSLWIKLPVTPSNTDPSNFDVILASEDSTGKHTSLLIYDHYSNGFQISVSNRSYTLTKTIQLQRNTWHHVTITWTQDEGIVHYVDSKMFSTNGTTVLNASSERSPSDQLADLYLAYSTTAGDAIGSYRDLAIWNYRLAEKHVKAIYQYTPGCQEIPVKEWNMSASSYSDHYTPDDGYLYSHTAWCANPKISTSYLQIELTDLYKIHSLVIRGKEYGTKEYVKTFQMKYSVNATDWKTHSKTFSGPSIADQQKLIALDNPAIVARYLRIYPLTSSGRKCLRMRLCGEKHVLVNITASVEHGTANGQRSSRCSIKVNNQEHCPNKPGHNIVAISHLTGELVRASSFDTKNSDSAGDAIIQFIKNLSNGTLVIVAVKDSGHRISVNARTSLYNIGAKSISAPPVNTAWILLGCKGALHKFLGEKTAPGENGLLVLKKMLPVIDGLRMSHFWPLRKTDYTTPHGNPKRPWYNKYFRDIVAGLDFYHNSERFAPFIGTIRMSSVGTGYSKSQDNDCLFRPKHCPGGITVSLWLKAEHSGLLGGEKDDPQYHFHRATFVLRSYPNDDAYMNIESKVYKTTKNTGHFVVLVDYATGHIKGQETFDVINDATAQDRFTNFLNEAPNGTIVLVLVKRRSKVTSPALINALKAVGARDPAITASDRYILIGYKGMDRWDWIEEAKWSGSSIYLHKKTKVFGAWTSDIGIEDGTIQDWQFTSAQQSSFLGLPHHGRLNTRSPGWYGGTTVGDYLQIQLPIMTLMSGIITQGASSEAAWVKSYKIDYSVDGQTWMSVKDGSVVTEFTGNKDQHSPMTQTFRRTFNTRFLRIIPLTFHIKIIMRVEGLHLNNAHLWLKHQPPANEVQVPVRPKPLVFDEETNSTTIVSSSRRNAKYNPNFAGLHSIQTCWCPDNNNDQMLKVKFKERVLVTSIAIQGNPSSDDWVTVFRLTYQADDGTFKYYRENGVIKDFTGNHDRHTVVVNQLNSLLYTTVVKIKPQSWQKNPCLRFEIFGYPMQTACFGPLGIQNNWLPDNRLSASTSINSVYTADKARMGLQDAAWCATLSTSSVYLQVDLGEPTIVTGIATKGGVEFRTKQFYIAYSRNGLEWSNHTRDDDLRIFDGNIDYTSVVVTPLDPSVEARFIRVYPMEPRTVCLQIELYGCYKENPLFALVGPLEINVPHSSTITIRASYRFCPYALSCPGCKRQIYMEVFDLIKCVVSEVIYDCKYHQFNVTYQVPSTPQIYNIRMFDVIGEGCNTTMKRNISGKIVGRVLAKGFGSKSCLDVLLKGYKKNGVYHIRPRPTSSGMTVYCDHMTHGGGWTVVQRRINGTVDFYKTWDEYKYGFGNLEGEFWLGNSNLHLLTSTPVELLIEMEKFSGDYYYAKYNTFIVDNEQSNYKLHVDGYSGTAGDSLSFHNEVMFSTKDQNNDDGTRFLCATGFGSAWWYKQCKRADLNGVYVPNESGINWKGIKWDTLLGASGNLKSVQMKIRPKEGSLIRCLDKKCYYLLKSQKYNFYQAHKACLAMGAELASITSDQETKEVKDMLSKAGVPSAYIGLNDRVTERKNVWADGTTSSYAKWKAYTVGNKDCVIFCHGGQWCPVVCDWSYHALCARNLMCFKGFCYKSFESSVTNDDATSMCQNDGMNLMKLETDDQIQYATKYMMNKSTAAATDAWMGLNDKTQENKFTWHDKSSLTNAHWATLEPTNQNGNEDCTIIATDGKYKAVPCARSASQVCQKPTAARSCLELLELGETKSGIYYIHPDNVPGPIKVYCDQEQDGGGWEVFFRRQDGSLKFDDKLWAEFKVGFGDPEKEFWLGLDKIARLGSRELILRLKTSGGKSKYINYGYFDVFGSPFEARIGWHRGGSLGGEIGRINRMRFSTKDKDNDYFVNETCTGKFGPGWLWTSRHQTQGCFHMGMNLFGAYSPTAVGNEISNLFYASFPYPITYIEMKVRYNRGHTRSVLGTKYPMGGNNQEGFSLQYTPHQFSFHLSTQDKAWFLVFSPSAYWTYYTFAWSEHNGIRSYENALLVSQDKEFRNVLAYHRGHFYLNVGDIYTRGEMYRFLTRMKAWIRDLTARQINADFNEAYFTLEGDETHWDKADTSPYKWTINSNCTKSKDTGPCVDHTSGFTQGSYYYLESSYPIHPGDSATLKSQVFFPRYHKCFSFWYYMYGDEMGELVVEMETYNRTPHSLTFTTKQATLMKKTGNQGKRWKLAMFTLSPANLFSLKIKGIVGQGYNSDIAIDDISVTMSECAAGLSNCDPPCKEGFTCLEDKGACDCKGLKHVDHSCYDVLNGSIFREASHYWPLDETLKITNLLGAVHGNTTGDVKSMPGPVNYALVTDGTTGQIVLGNLSTSCILSSPSCPHGFTFWFWLKFPKSDVQENKVYLSVGHDIENSRGIQVLQDFNVIHKPHLIINATVEDTSCIMAFEVHATIWSVIAVIWGRTSGLTIYHNGKNITNYQLYKCSVVASVNPSNSLLRTGYQGVSPALTIDDTVVWHRELAAMEIRKIFRFFTAPQKTIVLSVKFLDEVFQDGLRDRESQNFTDFNKKLLANVQAIFTGKSINFKDIFINELSNGSVNARLSLHFHTITTKELHILNDAVCFRQAFHNMPIELLSNTGTVFGTSADIRHVTFCQNMTVLDINHSHRYKPSSCNITLL